MKTEVADSHRKLSVCPLQFGLSLSALLLTEENLGSRWLQFPENPERQQYYTVHSHSSTRDVEQDHWRRQPALSAATASWRQTPHHSWLCSKFTLGKILGYYYTSWVSRGLVKMPESKSSHTGSS